MSGDTDRKTAALHALARKEYEDENSPPTTQTLSLSWGSMTRRTALVGVLGSLGATLFAGSAAAAPGGTFPSPAHDPLLKIRADRLRLVERSGAPAAPNSGRVTLWTETGDL